MSRAHRRQGVATPGSTVRGMPNQPKTRKHGVRVPEDLWQAAMEKAHREGRTLTEVIIDALKRYLRD